VNKKMIIIAGPNGAGKTTFARAFLPEEAQCPHFINADLIAAGLSQFAPESAAVKAECLMLQEIAACAAKGESFAFETTLSGVAYLRHIREWQQAGITRVCFSSACLLPKWPLPVAERVRQGGHNVPEPVIRRRFAAGKANFERHHRAAVDAWALYDNSGIEPVMIEWGER
jgi:predicted ABC-type ATPase